MHEIINIMTLVRGIRKLFVIERDDQATFQKLVAFCSEDLNGIRTLILLNDEQLFSENTTALIRAHDPDAILNYSKACDQSLYDHFRIKVVQANHQARELQPYRTHLATVQQYPAVLRNMFAYQGKSLTLDDTVYAVLGTSGKDEEETDRTALRSTDELCFAVNCGLVSPGFFDMREFGVFRDLRIESVTNYRQMIDAIRNDDAFLQISTYLPETAPVKAFGNLNHNVDRPFQDRVTAVIGAVNDLRALTYFWNERASNERIAIEAKSRRRPGTLHQKGEMDFSVVKADIFSLYNQAMEQNPGDKPFGVFIDVNVPHQSNRPLHARDWINNLLQKTAEEKEALFGSVSPNFIAVTNSAWHYEAKSDAGAGEYMLMLAPKPSFRFSNPLTLEAVYRALNVFSEIPDEE